MLKSKLVTKLIRLAIEEDLALGDITSDLSISSSSKSKAFFLAKQDLVLCGQPVLDQIVSLMKAKIKIKRTLGEGAKVKSGQVFSHLTGSTKDILAFERTALNFLQRLSGIATVTQEAVSKVKKIKILDTRKTTPGMRILEKYAVKTGGGTNHRMSLGDMILVKNNHLDSGQSLEDVLRKIRREKPRKIKMEVEVRNMEELKRVLPFKPDIIMLDNMSNAQIKNSVALIRKLAHKIKVEVSGGITLKRLSELDSLGIDYVSMGALTNRAQSVDISLRVQRL